MMKKYFHFLLIPIFLMSVFILRAQEEEFGLASTYGDEFQGRRTAYGDTYDKNQLTAAHKKHPYGTLLRVTRLDNKKSVTVRVNDKGPFIKGRVVDLSHKAAQALGLDVDGIAQVKVEVVKKSESASPAVVATTPKKTTEPQPVAYDEADKPKQPVAAAKEEKKADQPAPAPKKAEQMVKEVKSKGEAKSSPKFAVVREDFQTYGLYRIVLEKPEKKGFGVQVANLTSYENVMKQVADLQAKWFDNILISIEPAGTNKSHYKVILGPFDSEASAEKYQASLKKKYKISGFTINLADLKF